jgi:phosphotriesterase-related protein
MDRFGLDMFNPTQDRVNTIASLVEQGYADRMVLAHDASCYIDYFSGEQSQQLLNVAAPNWNFNHIPDDVLPALSKAGVSDSDIDVMLVDNARRYFGG